MSPSIKNPLRLYTELAMAPNDTPLVLEEFANLGPTVTVQQLTDMWLSLHQNVEWTIFVCDPTDFVDCLTAVSRNKTERDHYGNFRSWSIPFAESFYKGVMNTTGSLLIVIGERKPEDIPFFWNVCDRTVIIKAPDGPVPLSVG